MVGKNAVGAYRGLDLGSRVRIGPGTWTVVGHFDAGGSAFDSEVWADADVLNGAYQRPSGVFQTVTARLRSPDEFPAFKAQLERDQRVHVQAVRELEYTRRSRGRSRRSSRCSAGSSRWSWGLSRARRAEHDVPAVAERSREIAVLRALGFRGSSVVLSFLAESMWIAFIGGVLGCLLALPVNGITTGTINWQTFSHLAFAFRITPDLLALGLLFAVFMGLVGGLPAIRAARANVSTTLRAL